MVATGKIDAVSRQYFNPVDAIKLYSDTNKRLAIGINEAGMENPFAQTRTGMGLWQQPTMDYVGQVNGLPPTEYTTDEFGAITEVERTFNIFA